MTKVAGIAASINKKLGEDTIVLGNTLLERAPVSWLSTGSLALDVMYGGGWVRNQWNEVVGIESSGKTALLLKAVARNQQMDPDFLTFWVAAEDLDPEWAELLGVDLSRILVMSSSAMEEAYQACIEVIEGRSVDLVVIDSYPALSPIAEIEKSMEEFTVGRGAYLTNQFMRKANKSLKRIDGARACTCVMINQWRSRIGVVRGDPRTTPGGQGKNYAYWTRAEVSRTQWITHGKEKIGLTTKARTFKNKAAPVQREAELDFYFDDGGPVPAGNFDVSKEVTLVAMAFQVIERRNSWYDYRGEALANGREGLYKVLLNDPSLCEKVYADVMAKARGEEPAAAPKRAVKRRNG